MLSSTRPSSQSYQVAAVCGDPSGRSVATIAGFGRARNSDTSDGTGTRGTLEPYEATKAEANSSARTGFRRKSRTSRTETPIAEGMTTQTAPIQRDDDIPITCATAPAIA